MNEYHMDQLEEGKTEASFSVTVTDEMIDMFRQMSGDDNPLHLNREYAVSRGMKDKVVYGMLVSSFYSRLVGMYLPGKFCILHEIRINFNRPVYSGERLCVSGIVVKKKELFQRVEINAKIVNQNGEKVSGAKIVTGVFHE